jgi:hypothetical protein
MRFHFWNCKGGRPLNAPAAFIHLNPTHRLIIMGYLVEGCISVMQIEGLPVIDVDEGEKIKGLAKPDVRSPVPNLKKLDPILDPNCSVHDDTR